MSNDPHDAARGPVTDAMCRAAMHAFSETIGEPFGSVWEQMGAAERAELLTDWRHILTAALSAQGRADGDQIAPLAGAP